MEFWYYAIAAVMFFFIFDVLYMSYSLVLRRWRSSGISAGPYILYVAMVAIEATYLMWSVPLVLDHFF